MWADDREQALLAEHDVKVMHCPGSNLKLGSGIAPVAEMRRRGITVSLGADGAACNNRLDMFEEMRLAALLQAVRGAPGALAARDVLWMATRGGARTLGLESEIGSVGPVSSRTSSLSTATVPTRTRRRSPTPPWCMPPAARMSGTTIVDGELLIDTGKPVRMDRAEIVSQARAAAGALRDAQPQHRVTNPANTV